MGAIRDAANSAFRDYIVDGVAASGPNKPSKHEIESAFGIIEDTANTNATAISALQSSQASSTIVYDTLAHLNADLAHAANTWANVYADPTALNNGTYIKVGASGSGSWLQTSTIGIPDLTTISDRAKKAYSVSVKQTRAIDRIVAGTNRIDLLTVFIGATFLQWAVGITVAREVAIPSAILFWVANLSQIATFRLKIYARPLVDGNGVGPGVVYTFPGEWSHDTLLLDKTYPIASETDVPLNNVPQPVRFDFGGVIPSLRTDTIYFAVLSAKNGAGTSLTVPMQKGRQIINTTFDPIWKQGAYKDGSSSTALITSGDMVAYALYETFAVPVGKDGTNSRDKIAGVPVIIVNGSQQPISPQDALFDSNTWSFLLPDMQLDHQPNPTAVAVNGSGTVGVPKVPVSTVTGEAVTLTYQVQLELAHQWVDNVIVHRVSDGATLVEGTDYSLARDLGIITGLVNTAAFAITIDYDWAPHRYDIIAFHPSDGVLQREAGTNRTRDPNEYFPPPVSTYMPIYSVYVNRNNIEVAAMHEWSGYVRFGREAEHHEWIRYCRNALPKTLKIIHQYGTLNLAAYGDSIMALGGGTDFYTPNGATRDLVTWLSSRYPSDTMATIPKFNGPAGTNAHIHASYVWVLINALLARFNPTGTGGLSIAYQNWGIPTSDASNALNGGGYPGGNYPARLSALTSYSPAPDLTLIGFGMNEFALATSPDTEYANIRNIINNITLGIGRECIVVTPPRPNPSNGWVIEDWWLQITRAQIRAAIDSNVPYVDFSRIAGPGNEGCFGLSPRTMCDENLTNHPGYYEMQKYGGYIAEIFSR